MILEPNFGTIKYGPGLSFSQNSSQQVTYPLLVGSACVPSQSQIGAAGGGDIKKCTLIGTAKLLLSATSKHLCCLNHLWLPLKQSNGPH